MLSATDADGNDNNSTRHRYQSSYFLKLEEVNTQKSAKTHTCNVFVTLDLDL